MSKVYRIVPLGPTGSGKSQLCNFILQDKSNRRFEVSDGLNSKTKNPQIEKYMRRVNQSDIKIELIDTPGCSDSAGDDEKNFISLIDKLREIKSIDLFLLVFNFTNRIDQSTRNYLKLIASTFTPMEFYNHLAIVFTNYRENPSKRDIEKKNTKVKEIIDILKDTIGISSNYTTFIPEVYELDTEKDDNGNFIPKFQATIDIILLKMQTIYELNGEILTHNIKYNRVKDRIIEEQEKIKKIKEQLEKQVKEKEKNIQKYKKKYLDIKKQFDTEIEQYEEEIKEYRNKDKNIQRIDSEAEEKKKKYDIKIRELDELISKNNSEALYSAGYTIGGVALCFFGPAIIVGVPLSIYSFTKIFASLNESKKYEDIKKELEKNFFINK